MPRCPGPALESRRGRDTSTAPSAPSRPLTFRIVKASADRVHAPGSGEHFLEMREGEAEDLDVEILVRQAEEGVAHGAAHEVGAVPGVPERLQETTHLGRDLSGPRAES